MIHTRLEVVIKLLLVLEALISRYNSYQTGSVYKTSPNFESSHLQILIQFWELIFSDLDLVLEVPYRRFLGLFNLSRSRSRFGKRRRLQCVFIMQDSMIGCRSFCFDANIDPFLRNENILITAVYALLLHFAIWDLLSFEPLVHYLKI